LQVNEASSYQGDHLRGKRVRNLLNRDNCIDAWKLLLLRDSVKLDFVSYLAPEREENHIRNQGAHKYTPFHFEPDKGRFNAFWVKKPFKRLREHIHAPRNNRD